MPKKKGRRKPKKAAGKKTRKVVAKKSRVAKKVRKAVKKVRKKAKKVVKKARKKLASTRSKAKSAVRPKKTGKKSANKPARAFKPPMVSKPAGVPMVNAQPVGVVVHYYSHLSVAVVRMDQGSLDIGDSIHIKGHTTDLRHVVDSMEFEHQPIQRASIGQECAIKVPDHVREHDVVYKVLG